MTTTRRRRVVIAVFFALLVVVAVVSLWCRYQRPGPEATPAMRQAMQSVVRNVYVSSQPPAPAAHPSTQRERLLAAAWKLLGVPYAFGAKGPDELDCSGFTRSAYKAVGVKLPNGSYNQARGEQPLPAIATLVPGDLLFYRWAGHKSVSHVTMYAGDGWVIGTGTPGQPDRVVVYPITYDLRADGRIITYRHIALSDETPGSKAAGSP